jgi:aryl-alcohol dehydrogenase-like predicted oxidoreductase
MRRRLGDTRHEVNPVGLGAMPLSIQGRPDERTALEVIRAFVDNGGDFIDTAISYCLDNSDLGHNERLIAKALRGSSNHDVLVATKGGLTRPQGRWDVDASPKWLRECCEHSVRNLGGPIRLYYLHAVDGSVPFGDSLGELVRLKDEGKIENIGLSNVTARHLDDALEATPVAAVQNRCNIFDRRDFDNGLVRHCAERGVSYVPYSPVGGHFGHRRIAGDATLAQIAEKHGTTPYVVALAWLLAQGEHILPIPGASKVSSITSSLRSANIALDAADLAALDRDHRR